MAPRRELVVDPSELPGLYAARHELDRAERKALRGYCDNPCDRASVRAAAGFARHRINLRIHAALRASETPAKAVPTPTPMKRRSTKTKRVEWDGDSSVCGRFSIQTERPLHEGTIRYLLVKRGGFVGWADASAHRGYRACADKLRGDDTLRGAKHDAQVLADWEHENPLPDSKEHTHDEHPRSLPRSPGAGGRLPARCRREPLRRRRREE